MLIPEVINMTSNFDQEMQQYFDSLPAYVQEIIKQTSVAFKNKQELEQCAQNMMKSANSGQNTLQK